jgi:hypothetical protein
MTSIHRTPPANRGGRANRTLEHLLSCIYKGILAPEHLADLLKSGLSDENICSQKIRSVPPSGAFTGGASADDPPRPALEETACMPCPPKYARADCDHGSPCRHYEDTPKGEFPRQATKRRLHVRLAEPFGGQLGSQEARTMAYAASTRAASILRGVLLGMASLVCSGPRSPRRTRWTSR